MRSAQPVALRQWVEHNTAAVRPYAAWTLAGVAAITTLRLLWLALQPADLFPDEAQYWVWSQQLALGYYSKPPLVAWLIAGTTGLFGDSELAVRLSAPLLHAGAAFFVYGIGARLYDRRVWVLVGAHLCEPAWRLGLSFHHLDRCSFTVVLGCCALCVCPCARRGRIGLVAGGGAGGGARAAGEVRDGLLASVGARLCPRVSRRAPPFAAAAGLDRHRTSDLFTEFLVELEQRLCQLPPYQRQCRTERTAIPPGRVS